MEAVIPWLTPALIIALGAWLRADMHAQGAETNRRIDDTNKRIDELRRELSNGISSQFGETNRRIDDLRQELGGQITSQIGELNTRIDNVLLADRRQAS